MFAKISHYFLYMITGLIILIVMPACVSVPDQLTETADVATQTPTPTNNPTATESAQATQEPTPQVPCTISLWHSFDADEIESLLSVSTAYKENNPDVEFDFMYSPEFDIRSKFESTAGSGGGPSILIGNGTWGPSFYEDSLILDVTNLVEEDIINTINPAALSSVQYREAIIGLPLNLKGVLLFRNAYNIPTAPETFSALIDSAVTATSGDVIGAYLDYGLFYSGGHLQAVGGSLMDQEGNPAFNNDKGIQWLEMLKRFKEAGPAEPNNDNDLNLFGEGRVGFIVGDFSNAARLSEAIGENNFMIDPWPMDMSGYTQSDVVFLNADLSGNELDCGSAFMNFLLSNEAQEEFSKPEMAGFIPSITGVDFKDSFQQQAALAFEKGTPLPILPEMSLYWEPLNAALLSVVEFGTDPAEALTIAEQTIINNITTFNQE